MFKLKEKFTYAFVAAGLALLTLGALPAAAQVPSSQPPYNIDLGALLTNTARVPGTYNSAAQQNLDKVGAICTYVVTFESGSPSVTFNIQNFDAASGDYYTVVTSGASTAFNTPQSISIEPGNQIASLPTAVLAAASLPLSRVWRVQEIITGAGTQTTGTFGCNVVRN